MYCSTAFIIRQHRRRLKQQDFLSLNGPKEIHGTSIVVPKLLGNTNSQMESHELSPAEAAAANCMNPIELDATLSYVAGYEVTNPRSTEE